MQDWDKFVLCMFLRFRYGLNFLDCVAWIFKIQLLKCDNCKFICVLFGWIDVKDLLPHGFFLDQGIFWQYL